ncbi:MAG: methylated-DNA--[protein]-cysteine S-methyltransferase [Muribaculaceae bacterium]|nr:methylated-DNA--[protein]-cysteine S-methyltransferase [Muribaculaceae bacterium]
MILYLNRFDSPCGPLILGEISGRLCICEWFNSGKPFRPSASKKLSYRAIQHENTPLLSEAASQLADFFNGNRKEFSIPLDAHGSEFQKTVWHTLATIPYGATATYGRIAQLCGRPSAIRAVAGATGANPLNIFIPCHRIVAADGPGGYAGGPDAKQFILALEHSRSRQG